MMEMCMLTVEDSKHDVRDNEDVSSEVAGRKTHVVLNHKSTQSHGCSQMSRLRVPGKLGILGDCTCQNIA